MFTSQSIENIFQSAVTLHYSLETFGTGENWEFDPAGNYLLPALWLEQPYTYTRLSQNAQQWNIAFQILDKPRLSENDESELLENTWIIGNEVIEWVKRMFVGQIIIDPTWNAVSLTEVTDDSLVGWRFELTMKNKYEFERCGLPFSGFPLTNQ